MVLFIKECHLPSEMSAQLQENESEPNACTKEETVEKRTDECRSDWVADNVQSKPDENLNKQDASLDTTLEEAARRRNLSTLNVKSIIHVRRSPQLCV